MTSEGPWPLPSSLQEWGLVATSLPAAFLAQYPRPGSGTKIHAASAVLRSSRSLAPLSANRFRRFCREKTVALPLLAVEGAGSDGDLDFNNSGQQRQDCRSNRGDSKVSHGSHWATQGLPRSVHAPGLTTGEGISMTKQEIIALTLQQIEYRQNPPPEEIADCVGIEGYDASVENDLGQARGAYSLELIWRKHGPTWTAHR